MGKNNLNVPANKPTKDETQLLQQQEGDNLEPVAQVYTSDEEDTSTSAYLWLLVFSVLMFTFPFLTFYGVRSWLDESFEFSTFQTNCFSVLASVIVVNFIICLYVYKAFREDLKPRYVRVNTNLLSMEEALTMLAKEEFRKLELPPFENYEDFLKAIQDLKEEEYMLDMHVDNLLIFHPKNKHYLACHQYTKERKFMLQDKGTCLVAELLHPPVGSTVLDMCAAPGMKTIHTCNVLQNQGIIYSVEQSPERYRILCNMTESAGCKIVQPIKGDALAITPEQCPGVEYILVDPSCTGSGIQNRLSLEPEEKSPERLKKLAGLQIKMLSYAMSTFPDVKRIAYSTCSLYEEENEQVVQKCLQLNPNFKLLSGKKALRNKWRSVGSSEYKKIGKNCIYTRPEEDLTDGIFIAIFEKCNSAGDE
ncbi:hypothetical protein FF38_06788 [Lucilia cuprina]|uniref:SAM-dependent MTase RsmB/NOP-type domain-containing protein n=1 Tax=Lucilia cuprina TaxID=7375 RepID=A0A0L0CNZ8_LUCCU|nr:hypothetical protein FF38_06788 [Lucilia cuprina]